MNPVSRITILFLLVTLLSACGGGAQETAEPTMDVNAILTSAVGTFAISMQQTQTALVPPATETSAASPTATNTALSLPVLTTPQSTPTVPLVAFPTTIYLSPTPTGTRLTPTVNPASLGSGCNNLLLIQDVTIPAGTVMLPKQSFTKTWKVANTGTCDWLFQYQLVFASGDRMDGEGGRLNKVIEPGKWTQLSVNLTAPSKPGTYTGNWRFANQQGIVFGSTLTVSIVVANPTNTPVPPTSTATATPTPTETSSYPNP